MTEPLPGSPPPGPRPLSPAKLLLRTLLGVIVLAIGIYTLTRKAATPPAGPTPTTSPSSSTTGIEPTPPDAATIPSPQSSIPSSPTQTPSPVAPKSPQTPKSPADATIVAPTPPPPAPPGPAPAVGESIIAFAPDGRLLIARGGAIEFRHLVSGAKQPVTAKLTAAKDITTTRDGRTVVIAAGGDPTIVYSVIGGISRTLPEGGTVALYSPDQRTLATGHASGELRLWDAITLESAGTLGVSVGPIRSIAISPDGGTIAAAGLGVAVWDLPAKRVKQKLAAGQECPSIAFSSDSHTLAIAGGDGVTLWETVFWRKVGALAPGQAVTRVAYWRNGTSIVMSLADGSIQLWDPTTRTRTATLPSRGAITMFALSPDDRTLATSSASGITLWDTTTRNPRALP